MTKLYTLTETIKNMPEKDKIVQMLERLSASGIVDRFKGNCISASDIIQNMLSFYGVNSKIIECQVFVVKDNNEIKDFRFIGFNDIGFSQNTVDTHVVVVTETNPPVLIDGSLGHLLPNNEHLMLRELDSKDPTCIGTFNIGDVTLTYQNKKNLKLPNLHQKTLVERLKSDGAVATKITFLTRAVIALGAFSLVNFTLNCIQIFLKLTM